MGCGCGKKTTPQSVQAQAHKIEQLRAETLTSPVADAPNYANIVAKKVAEHLSKPSITRCFTDAYCPPGTKCINGHCS